jgi:conjugative relaxase-like TrwC/TraI family protein
VYQSDLAMRLKALGYEIEQGKNGAPEIKGYTKEYVEASSPRSQQIREHMAEQGRSGAGAAPCTCAAARDPQANCAASTVRAAEAGDA